MNSNPIFQDFIYPSMLLFKINMKLIIKKKAISLLKFVLLIMTKKERKNHPEL